MRRDKNKIFNIIIGAFIILGLLLSLIKLPIHLANIIVPFDFETPNYIPMDTEKKYVKIVSLDTVKVIYEHQGGAFILWATTEIGWNNVSNWEEKLTLQNGKTAFYTEADAQIISWRNDKVEYAIDYIGNTAIAKEELIAIASSIN